MLARTQFNTVSGRYAGKVGDAIYAVGQDRASVLMYAYLPEPGWVEGTMLGNRSGERSAVGSVPDERFWQ